MRNLILTPGELPLVGSGYEGLAVDFKGSVPVGGFELAKDVAAFANASGGTILHRAHEDKARRVLGRYQPLTQEEAGRVVSAYDQSIRDRCSPPPVWIPERLEHEGGFIVAVNVQPFPGQVVGVKVWGDKLDGHGDAAYVFPVRVGTQTRWLQPGELAMYMVPEVRMTIVALEAIPAAELARVTLIQVLANKQCIKTENARIVGVEPEKNAVRFESHGAYPLNRVHAVWHNGRAWCVSVDMHDIA